MHETNQRSKSPLSGKQPTPADSQFKSIATLKHTSTQNLKDGSEQQNPPEAEASQRSGGGGDVQKFIQEVVEKEQKEYEDMLN